MDVAKLNIELHLLMLEVILVLLNLLGFVP